jgi:hypothetical protein
MSVEAQKVDVQVHAEREARKLVVRELLDSVYAAASKGEEQNPATHPFWQDVDPADIPKVIFVATGSNRKRLMLAAQLALLDGQELPAFFDQFKEKGPLEFWNIVKNLIYNGNGATDEEETIGWVGGVRVVALPNNGEQNMPGFSMADEALHKTRQLKAEIKAGKYVLPGLSEEDIAKSVVVGLDTLGRVVSQRANKKYVGDKKEVAGYKSQLEFHGKDGIGTGKPRRVMEEWFLKEAEWGVGLDPDSKEHKNRFRDWYVREYFEGGSHIENMTGIAVESINKPVNEASISISILDTEVDLQKAAEVAPNLDLDAALGGMFQMIVDWEKLAERELLITPEHYDFFQDKADFPLINFILLCQIIGVPLHLIAFEIRESLFSKDQKRERSHQRNVALFERHQRNAQDRQSFGFSEDASESGE